MRLEPVFLVAPAPKPPSMPTRRAFLLAGSTFTLGLGLGGACGYSLGARTVAEAAEPAPAEVPLESSGDAQLDEMRRLAVKAPVEELFSRRLEFLDVFATYYRDDQVLWRGVARLVSHVLDNERLPGRAAAARQIAQVIERGDPPFRAKYGEYIDPLRRCR